MTLLNHNILDNKQYFFTIINVLLLTLLLGCQTQATPLAKVVSDTPPTEPTVAPSSTPTPTDTPIAENTETTLVFWTVEQISPNVKGDIGNFINKSLSSFQKGKPNVKVQLFLKKASGKGGMLDFLKTAKQVAPSILPDVVIMNATDLEQAYTNNLIVPLDGRLDRTIIQDLLPAARKIGTVNEKLVGIPIGLEMQHTVYNTHTFSSAKSLLWGDILSASTRYVFPAKGINGLVNDATLSQYFSVGGRLLDDQGTPKIDERALQDVLKFYQELLDKKIIDKTILESATPEELWSIYMAGEADIAQISVHQYLTDRETLKNTAWGSVLKTPDTVPIPIMQGWVLTLVTDDIHRQKIALNLLEWFLSTSNSVTWNSLNKSIPPRDTAFQRLAGNDPYWQFLAEQLNTARPLPNFTGYDQVGRIIQQAIQQVIKGEASPEEATVTAIDALAK